MIALTMEETFVVTYISSFIVGMGLGFLTYLFIEKENKND